MFILGGLGEERTVPVGASFSDRGMRNDQHDAVAAQLMIPIRQILRGNVPPAAGGAPQPAETASHAEQHFSRAAGGGPQPAEAPSDADQPISPDWEATNAQQDTLVQDTALNKAARDLHENLLHAEEAEDIPVNQQYELQKILFKKKDGGRGRLEAPVRGDPG